MESKVLAGQNFLDKLLELTGSIDDALSVAELNDMGITDDISKGNYIKAKRIVDKKTVDFFKKHQPPATAIANYVDDFTQLVIGTMVIKKNFIIG